MASDPTALARWAAGNPEHARRLLDKLAASRSLIEYSRLLWPIIEPMRPMIVGKMLHILCEHLEAVTAGQIKRLLINIPPGTAKSTFTQIMWPTWEWGPRNRPDLRYIKASYAEHLTQRDNRKALQVIRSPVYQELWGRAFDLDPDEQSKTKFANTKTGWMLATSVSGTGTGERGDRFIIDDPMNAKEVDSEAKLQEALQWFTEVVPTRINDPETSAMVLIMQRVAEGDVSGHVLEHDLGWDRLILPMEFEVDHPHKSRTALNFVDWRTTEGELLCPERFSQEHIEKDLKPTMRSWGGEYAVSGQLQQRPSPRGGGMFKIDGFQVIERAQLPTGLSLVRGWDLAASKDGRAAWTVGALMGRSSDGRIFIINIQRIRGSPHEVDELIRTTAKADGQLVHIDLPQDPGQAGKSQKSHIAKNLEGHSVRFSLESGSKEDRARPLASQVEAGNVYLVRAPWNNDFLAEVAMFPAGRYKDQVDATSRAYARLISMRSAHTAGAGKLFEGNG